MRCVVRISWLEFRDCIEAKNLHLKRRNRPFVNLFKNFYIEKYLATVNKVDWVRYYAICEQKSWWFVLLYPILFIENLIDCMIHGGLKEFTLPKRFDYNETVSFDEKFKGYNKIAEIYRTKGKRSE